MNERPLINENGNVHTMTVEQYSDYLQSIAEMNQISKPQPSPEDRLTALEIENVQLKQDNEDLWLALAEAELSKRGGTV